MTTLKTQSTTKTRFTRKFLSCLVRMRRASNSAGSSSNEEILRRSHRIKVAAYSSMARAVGSKRIWSRALLLKLRNRTRLQGILRNKRFGSKKKKFRIKNKVSEEMSKVDMLRELVPGGTNMDLCGLLEETAHFIKCLATQVRVMENIMDYYSK